jgi:hypothetical protein
VRDQFKIDQDTKKEGNEVESNKDTEDKKKEIPRYRWPRFTRSAL